MAEEVEAVGFARVTTLAERFGVSAVTVRSDLGVLESEGRLRRVRGGAVPSGMLRHEPTLEQAATENQPQKAAIARMAAAMVQPGQCVILDVGSTTTAIARELVERRDLHDVTIVTNGPPQVIDQIEAQLERLVPVHKVTDLTTAGPHVERELALIKVTGTGEKRVEALRLADIFRARPVDTTTESFIFEITGPPDKVDSFIALMRELGLVEVGRTGIVGMMRGAQGA